ncbi:MAG: DNA cytosine methyltransferase [Planctomycetes bacterium]|nr:DNA cytosine methyltransferase [Planctomycetota bacterium]MBU1518132.1 DNA cytosine methyltransferase [Planctomycetota bacterium]MBU2595942.1 DNA cytosine methyltransferase [Planctomycetota bacterium]
MTRELTYISLFSNAGIGCYGFKQAGFECIASNELLEERIKFQRYNKKCRHDSGYICGDITLKSTKDKIYQEIKFWEKHEKLKDVDVVIATPPCQGISVANHKKKNELSRNSLIVESILITKEINPKIFLFENVRGFLKADCSDVDGTIRQIKQAIELNLGNYNILYKIINFADYGNPSNRNRTVVLGVRKDLKDVTPFDIFPDKEQAPILRDTIGYLPALKKMGEISNEDVYHFFRAYPERMELWIKDLKEGQSAFEQTNPKKQPHQIKEGKAVLNKNKNGDKYSRCLWDRPGFCIHTRNDQLASQKTIHPKDNRVFSIREIMDLMSVPNTFKWSDMPIGKLNALPYEEKRNFLKKNELNIRRTLGEAVPTVIFGQIANKIKKSLTSNFITDKEINTLIEKHGLDKSSNTLDFLKQNISKYSFKELSKIAELSNAKRLHNAAYYTSQDICYTIIKDLPEFEKARDVKILEPSVGIGNFIPLIIEKYKDNQSVQIDVVDIDADAMQLLKLLLKKIDIPKNVKINFINSDFLSGEFSCGRYNLVIGNPPFKKLVENKNLLSIYKAFAFNQNTNNLFSFFIEKALKIGDYVAFVLPKTLLSSPEYNKTRELLGKHSIIKICDYGEKAFKIKIETISLLINTTQKEDVELNPVKIESHVSNDIFYLRQGYLSDKMFPYWIIYRNEFFDKISSKLNFDIFSVFRDRQITNKILSDNGKYRVLKSRNLGDNKIVNIKGYDCYISNIHKLSVSKFLNKKKAVLIPNLTYNPRACFLPPDTIADGSVAIAESKNGYKITKNDLSFYATDEFRKFYKIARNVSTRSMNIDSNSIFFFGLLKER